MAKDQSSNSIVAKVIAFCLKNKLVVFLVFLIVLFWGLRVAPFDWNIPVVPRDPVSIDALPDIGENQQIVFTEWVGRSPQDIEDQVTYPLTVSLLGVPGVKTIRSSSMFGFSTIYVIFNDDVSFYWSRSRILEKLNSLPPGLLPNDAHPVLGPDATALGQVYWYTIEGVDKDGMPTGGWDMHELKSIQDYYVRYALMSAEGVSEVASIGGFTREYQIDVDPDALRSFNVTLPEIFQAVKSSNLDVGAQTIEINKVEYVIRGIGFIKTLSDIENTVIKMNKDIPVTVKQIAHVAWGPANRRGALDKAGTEAVGGVVIVRYNENPLEVIKNVKKKIQSISPGLPQKTLPDGTVSKIQIVPFYDRTQLIHETLGTIQKALTEEILITIIVILVMIRHFKSSLLISGLLPLAVLMSFIFMKVFGVDANIVALSGIAIAIGTMVDMGVIIAENVVRHLKSSELKHSRTEIVFEAVKEVAGAVVTAVSTTIISFLPIFAMQAAEGKLFRPLAFTKTFALISSIIIAIVIIPPSYILLLKKNSGEKSGIRRHFNSLINKIPMPIITGTGVFSHYFIIFIVVVLLGSHWLPLGPENGFLKNLIFTGILITGILSIFSVFHLFYKRILIWCLNHKLVFLILPLILLSSGAVIWFGLDPLINWLPQSIRLWSPVVSLVHVFPGLSREFMPDLDEGSFLFMPTTMPHASFGEALDVVQKQDMAISALPEITSVVGKIGRADTPLDPAPISMIETLIIYHPEYLEDDRGNRILFAFDADQEDYFRSVEGEPIPGPDGLPYFVKGSYLRDDNGKLIENRRGRPFRIWRPALDPKLNTGRSYWNGIQHPDDIWEAIVKAAQIPGTTSAPKLQPIEARLVMLQSGLRSPYGVKIKGPNLSVIESTALNIESLLKNVPAINPDTVFADRIIGKPYLEIHIDRVSISRFGISIEQVQDIIEVAIGGKRVTNTVEGRERYSVRLRYLRELRQDMDSIKKILVPTPMGFQIPLEQIATIEYVRGPQVIKSEDTFLVGYVTFDSKPGYAELEVIDHARTYLENGLHQGLWHVDPGVSFEFSGNYENQVRAVNTLRIVLPVALILIFIILYFQFRSAVTSMIVFSSIFVAWAGGFLLIWLYGQSWFMNFSFFGVSMRALFQIHPINLSVAIWVGFLALFGIASDDGVVMATYLDQSFRKRKPKSISEIRKAAVLAGERRVRACLMTTATTVLALLPVLTSQGRGSDIMVPMAIPTFGGMLLVMITMFIVPVLYSAYQEFQLKKNIM
ncbi:efflux RND transporter permease subunit, partial [bacterium]|nr:efflux RND transporter permease subunit [candidate division CSSED10-310 bacterium]